MADVSTVGLFYSQAEAQKIVDMLRADPDRAVIGTKSSKR